MFVFPENKKQKILFMGKGPFSSERTKSIISQMPNLTADGGATSSRRRPEQKSWRGELRSAAHSARIPPLNDNDLEIKTALA